MYTWIVLSTSLNSTNIGGHIGGQLLNQLCYADDLCLISMSSAGMQCLLNVRIMLSYIHYTIKRLSILANCMNKLSKFHIVFSSSVDDVICAPNFWSRV